MSKTIAEIFRKLSIQIIAHFLFIGLLLVGHTAWATHIRAGEITVRRLNCSSFTFQITFTGYRDTSSDVIFGDGFLDFGDGSDAVLISPDQFTATPAGNNIEKNVLIVTHPYPANGVYVISYRELNRNAGTLNIDNSVDTPFYTETQIIIDPFVGCNQTPELLIPPVDEGCTQAAFYHNPGAFDPDGDSLSYEFVTPKQDKGVEVLNYRDPNTNEPGLYPNGYTTADETGCCEPTFTINPTTGDVVWDAPGAEGQYNIAFKIIEWRLIGGQYEQIGFVVRDMQILVGDCDNERPEIDIPEDICVEAGTLIDEIITGTDPDGHQVEITAASQLFNGSANQPVLSPGSGFRPVPATSQFTWQTACQNVREQPYQVIFKISDRPDQGPSLATFATWNITVVGAKPELLSATRIGQTAQLDFTPYNCNIAGDGVLVQIWRRVAEFPYLPGPCETGLPENSGYELIDEVGVDASSYLDSNNGQGLAWGAKYCYRLIAVFPGIQGGESIVSDEQCIDPIEVSAPTITHVSVLETSETTGRVRVSWRSPFELDLSTFALPLKYQIERATGLDGGAFSIVTTVNDTTFDDTGLNTEDDAFQYRITAFDNNDIEIETSFPASSVRLEPTPQFKKIELNWSANVPWSNAVFGQTHELWRDNTVAGSPQVFEKIADIEVTEAGFFYLDEGQHNGVPLEDTNTYCYQVLAKGSYGNPLINDPALLPPDGIQENYSQIVCSQPSDTIPPCGTTLTVDEIKCRPIGQLTGGGEGEFPFDNLPCDFADFKNTLTWSPSGFCGEDVDHYDLYFKNNLEDEYQLIASVDDTVFVHDNLPSYRGCYILVAVDRSGNESEPSNEVCKDNCPNYVLPNVFTPDNGDNINNTFRAYSIEQGSEGEGIVAIDLKSCPRFVKSVQITIFNRWGREVFVYDSQTATENGEKLSNARAILIDWDGRGKNGKELSSGVYFYSADVTFDAINRENKQRTIKGWVHLLR